MSSLSRDTRRIIVAHLTDRGMSPAEIAAELGVSRDTVRRDMEICVAQQATQTEPAAAPPAPGLLLPESPQLRQDLNVLAAAFKARPESVAGFAIHQLARHVRARVHAQFAAGDKQEVRS